MRKTLLTTIAVAALTAGSGLAYAQQPDHAPGGSAQPKAQHPAPAPEMKTAPSIKAPAHSASERANETLRQKADKAQDKIQRGADSEKAPAADAQTQEKSSTATGEKTDTKSDTAAQNKSNTDTKADTAQSKAKSDTGTAANASANPSPEQRTRIHDIVIKQGGAPKVTRSEINFNISVGTVVPSRVRVVALPSPVVEVYPEWRGYLYFIIGDQIVVVEPGTHEIVAIIT